MAAPPDRRKKIACMAARPERHKRREPAWLTGPLCEVYEVQINGCSV